MKLVIVDRSGWEKSVELDKAVVRLGSSGTNDVQLDSPDIKPTHLQFHFSQEEFSCKVLNLGNNINIIHGEYEEILRSYAHMELENDDEILLGEYRLRVQLPVKTKIVQTSSSINASLSFPNNALYPHTSIAGWLTVQNIGDRSPCQFHVTVSGMPKDCVQIDPIPLLYSGASEKVRIQLFQHGMRPRAGLTTLNIRVFAPTDYPGEHVLIDQGIYVVPVFEQDLDFVDENELINEITSSQPIPPSTSNIVTQSYIASSPNQNLPPLYTQKEMSTPKEKVDTQTRVPATSGIEANKSMPEESAQYTPPIEKETSTSEKSTQYTPPKENEKVKVEIPPKPVVARDLPEDFWEEGG